MGKVKPRFKTKKNDVFSSIIGERKLKLRKVMKKVT